MILNTRAQLLIVPEVCLNYDLKPLLHQNPRGYCSLQQIITVCSSCDCEEMCPFRHDLLCRQTPGPESRSFQIMPSIWCSHHCLCSIAAGNPFNLARVLCIYDATGHLEHLCIASDTEHPEKLNAAGCGSLLGQHLSIIHHLHDYGQGANSGAA